MRHRLAALAAVTLLTLHPGTADAQRMFARTPSQFAGYGYGNTNWTQFTSLWDARFGAANIIEGNSISSLAGYTSLYLDANRPNSSLYNLSAAERTEILSFMATGGRVYAFGENASWTSWNNSVLSLFGATFAGDAADSGTPLVNNVLTAGVTSIDTPLPGRISDFGPTGESLFSNDIAGLFGADQNALVVLDINICSDVHIVQADNRRFCENIVGYTAGDPITPPSSVPEPTSLALLGLGTIGLALRRRRLA